MMTASAPAALKQLSVCARVGGYDLRNLALSSATVSPEPGVARLAFGGDVHSVPSSRIGRHCSCSSGSSSEGKPQS